MREASVPVGSMQDDDLYRAWYRRDHEPGIRLKHSGHDTAYAESSDGIHWGKPNLGLFALNGDKRNNVVCIGAGANTVPFRDTNPEGDADANYKAIVCGSGCVFALASSNGLRWRLMQSELVMTKGL